MNYFYSAIISVLLMASSFAAFPGSGEGGSGCEGRTDALTGLYSSSEGFSLAVFRTTRFSTEPSYEIIVRTTGGIQEKIPAHVVRNMSLFFRYGLVAKPKSLPGIEMIGVIHNDENDDSDYQLYAMLSPDAGSGGGHREIIESTTRICPKEK